MANLMFKKGTWGELQTLLQTPDKIQDGALYLTYDEGDLYLGQNGSLVRIQGSLHKYATLTDFSTSVQPPYSTDIVYFIAEKNAFVRYDSAKGWIHLNITADDAKLLENRIAANESDITELTNTVSTNVTNIGGLTTRMDAAETAIGTKASQSDLNQATSDIAENTRLITGLRTDVDSKASQADFNEVSAQVTTNMNNIGTLQGQVNTINSTKVDKTEFNPVKTTVESHVTDIAQLKTDVANKASQEDFNEVSAQVATNTTNIGTLQGQVNTINTVSLPAKADKTALNDAVADIAEHQRLIEGLRTDVDSKASQEDFNEVSAQVTTNKNDISTLSTNKADKTTVDSLSGRVTKVENAVKTKAENDDVVNLEQRVTENESDISELQNQMTAKVDVVPGYGLSQNDFTTSHLQKLTDLAYITAVDNTITEDSTNPVTSGAVYDALNLINDSLSEHASEIAKISTIENTLGEHGTAIENLEDNLKDINDLLGNGEGTGSITDRIAALEAEDAEINKALEDYSSNISELQDQVNTNVQSINTLNAGLEEVSQGFTSLRGRVTANETNINGLTTRMGAAETNIGTNATNIAENAENIQANANQITTIQTVTIPALETSLNNEIKNKINAANAMTFIKTANAASDLPTSNVRVGDTYVVGTAFENYHPADLLIASGTENANGYITGGVTWEVVKTGYSTAYNPKMELGANSTIMLYDYAGDELGGVAIKTTSPNISITNDSGAISLSLQWGSFTD